MISHFGTSHFLIKTIHIMKLILIEVKYREHAPIPDDDAISELADTATAEIIVTKTADDFGSHQTKSGTEMLRIPAFAFLYLLGNAEKHGYNRDAVV